MSKESAEEQYEREILAETLATWQIDEKNASDWKTVEFVSYSAGRRKLKDGTIIQRIRKHPRYVTLTWYNGRAVNSQGLRLDEKMEESFGATVSGFDQPSHFEKVMEKLRRFR